MSGGKYCDWCRRRIHHWYDKEGRPFEIAIEPQYYLRRFEGQDRATGKGTAYVEHARVCREARDFHERISRENPTPPAETKRRPMFEKRPPYERR